MAPTKYYFLSTLLFTFILIILLGTKGQLSYFVLFPIIIFSAGIVTIHFFNKYMKREWRMEPYRKKLCANHSKYLEKTKNGVLSDITEYEKYLDYQDTKLFYVNKMIVGNFEKKYSISLHELNTTKLINKHALEFSRFLLDEPDVPKDYLIKRFIKIASTYHYVLTKPNT